MSTVQIEGKLFRELLQGAVTCTSKDRTLPLLCGVCISVTEGLLTVRATDRYRAIIGVLPVKHDGDFTVLIDRNDATRLFKTLAKIVVDVAVTAEEDELSVSWPGDKFTCELAHGTFPPLERLAAKEAGPSITKPLAFNAKYLATMSEVPNPRTLPWHLSYGENGSMLGIQVSESGPAWTFILAAMKVS
jgi:DNA polymerase III sliding clamp (beta) subunit (PCNA family)